MSYILSERFDAARRQVIAREHQRAELGRAAAAAGGRPVRVALGVAAAAAAGSSGSSASPRASRAASQPSASASALPAAAARWSVVVSTAGESSTKNDQ